MGEIVYNGAAGIWRGRLLSPMLDGHYAGGALALRALADDDCGTLASN